MCNACAFQCCASDEFEGCGCDHCYEPECWDSADADDFGDDMPGDDEDDGGLLMPLAACGCAPARGFRCEAIQP